MNCQSSLQQQNYHVKPYSYIHLVKSTNYIPRIVSDMMKQIELLPSNCLYAKVQDTVNEIAQQISQQAIFIVHETYQMYLANAN